MFKKKRKKSERQPANRQRDWCSQNTEVFCLVGKVSAQGAARRALLSVGGCTGSLGITESEGRGVQTGREGERRGEGCRQEESHMRQQDVRRDRKRMTDSVWQEHGRAVGTRSVNGRHRPG